MEHFQAQIADLEFNIAKAKDNIDANAVASVDISARLVRAKKALNAQATKDKAALVTQSANDRASITVWSQSLEVWKEKLANRIVLVNPSEPTPDAQA